MGTLHIDRDMSSCLRARVLFFFFFFPSSFLDGCVVVTAVWDFGTEADWPDPRVRERNYKKRRGKKKREKDIKKRREIKVAFFFLSVFQRLRQRALTTTAWIGLDGGGGLGIGRTLFESAET